MEETIKRGSDEIINVRLKHLAVQVTHQLTQHRDDFTIDLELFQVAGLNRLWNSVIYILGEGAMCIDTAKFSDTNECMAVEQGAELVVSNKTYCLYSARTS